MNRSIEFFNLSFLDLLCGALGAIIFLFIIVPKGEGAGPAASPQINVSIDTIQMKFYGDLPDSLLEKQVGDTLLALIFDYKKAPKAAVARPVPPQAAQQKIAKQEIAKAIKEEKSTPKPATPEVKRPQFQGSKPDVPCKLSIEVRWDDIEDNVDLFVCKDGDCVYGGRKRRPLIGFWDSGKSNTSLFGGDLRTTQESVRQFDAIIPGDYNIYVQFKESTTGKSSIPVNLLVFTKNDEGQEDGREYTAQISMNSRERTKIATAKINSEGRIESFEKLN